MGQDALAHVRAHGVANQPLFVGEQPRDIDEVDRVGHCGVPYRLRTRASLSKSASVERSNWSSKRLQSRRPSVSDKIASTRYSTTVSLPTVERWNPCVPSRPSLRKRQTTRSSGTASSRML